MAVHDLQTMMLPFLSVLCDRQEHSYEIKRIDSDYFVEE